MPSGTQTRREANDRYDIIILVAEMTSCANSSPTSPTPATPSRTATPWQRHHRRRVRLNSGGQFVGWESDPEALRVDREQDRRSEPATADRFRPHDAGTGGWLLMRSPA